MGFYSPVRIGDRYHCIRKWLFSFTFVIPPVDEVVDNPGKKCQHGKKNIASAVSDEGNDGTDGDWADAAS